MDYDRLAPEYVSLFKQCEARASRDKDHPVALEDVQDFVIQLLKGRLQYEQVESVTRVPWFFIGLIHGLEGGFSFSTHLHNGDSLARRTVNDPQGRPLGQPPFTWKESATDALEFERTIGTWKSITKEQWEDWGVSSILYKLEGYNGWGYRLYHSQVKSPYLWSGSNLYDKGKYRSDGRWDSSLVSKQVGAATALHYMTEKHIVSLKAVEA